MKFILSGVLISLVSIASIGFYIYKRDRNLFEPKLWIGYFDYRLNFRDVGESLNQCLNKTVYKTNKIYRSNRYFSGWSCDKISNPDKIYSLNYSPWNPHSYYCEQKSGARLSGIHANTNIEISDIEKLLNWRFPEYRSSMCSFFKSTLNDLIEHKSFLYHCDMGRDRTGTFTAMLAMMLTEQKYVNVENIQEAIECDYEKTPSIRSEPDKLGRMRNFLMNLEDTGGVAKFIGVECGIDLKTIEKAANEFVY